MCNDFRFHFEVINSSFPSFDVHSQVKTKVRERKKTEEPFYYFYTPNVYYVSIIKDRRSGTQSQSLPVTSGCLVLQISRGGYFGVETKPTPSLRSLESYGTSF